MRHLLAALLVLSLVAPVWAGDQSKTDTLTPKEITEGWLSLFDGETTFGWKDISKPAVRGGVLVHGGDQEVRASTTMAFHYYELTLEYRIEKTAENTGIVSWQPPSSGEIAQPLPIHKGWASASIKVEGDAISGSITPLIESEGGTSGFMATSRPKMRASAQPIIFGVPKGNKLSLRNVKLKPLGMMPIFNGKDLSHWKKFEGDAKRATSRFSVTKDGWLSIKNGPGDLQTTGEWADFVLQLDCRTNGDNLNSGIFFRCIPGQYQNGYEAQIQNQKAKEPKKYTIKEYDPKTHQAKGETKIENWSQDYGTGAIYRRIPARRAVAKDREWFSMTVIAHGRHLATWVNGIQVVDWTDNRPENENARNGCRLKKGPISLQGHDPTTDLSFRNIRIADMTRKD